MSQDNLEKAHVSQNSITDFPFYLPHNVIAQMMSILEWRGGIVSTAIFMLYAS